jgi:hypothetical protein
MVIGSANENAADSGTIQSTSFTIIDGSPRFMRESEGFVRGLFSCHSRTIMSHSASDERFPEPILGDQAMFSSTEPIQHP